jgi:acetyltransferase AlgX (SGNH hydrolase-like protein)
VRAPPWLPTAVACALAPLIVIAFGAPPGYALLAIPAVLVVASLADTGSAIALVASTAAALALYAGVLRVSGLDQAIYYRFHERFATWDARHGHRAYLPGVSWQALEPHGDLQVLTQEDIAEPRRVLFHSDSEGFRNDADFGNEPWVLIGDSFVVGVGCSQPDTLTARLAARGIRAYNLAHPGGPLDYESYWRSFVARHGRSSKPVLFMFEGNDFPETVGARERYDWWMAVDYAVRGAIAPLTRLSTYRVTRSLVARFTKRGEIDGEQVEVRPLAGARLAFWNRESRHARATELEDMALTDAALARMAPDLAAIFFIPTKYRVYQRWLAPDEHLPNASWQHLAELCEEYRVPCTDLTPALVARSEALLAEGRFTWWRDDTHWNGAGIDAAAERVAEVLRALRAPQ